MKNLFAAAVLSASVAAFAAEPAKTETAAAAPAAEVKTEAKAEAKPEGAVKTDAKAEAKPEAKKAKTHKVTKTATKTAADSK